MGYRVSKDPVVYLDYAAATPTDPDVIRKMIPYFDGSYGNPSSLYTSGRRAARAIAETKGQVAKILGAKSEEIIFTGSGRLKLEALICHENAIFSSVCYGASDLSAIAFKAFDIKQFTELAYSEPYYLKEFYNLAKN